jgi:hypothetical protein
MVQIQMHRAEQKHDANHLILRTCTALQTPCLLTSKVSRLYTTHLQPNYLVQQPADLHRPLEACDSQVQVPLFASQNSQAVKERDT